MIVLGRYLYLLMNKNNKNFIDKLNIFKLRNKIYCLYIYLLESESETHHHLYKYYATFDLFLSYILTKNSKISQLYPNYHSKVYLCVKISKFYIHCYRNKRTNCTHLYHHQIKKNHKTLELLIISFRKILVKTHQ